MSSVDVVVVGAGLAGLSAAWRLKESGASVRLLEARSRVGGRVLSEGLAPDHSQCRGQVIDLGAQFIGDAHTRMSSLVAEVGLTRIRRSRIGKSIHLASHHAKPVLANNDGLPLSTLGKLDAMQIDWRIGRHLQDLRRTGAAALDDLTAARYLHQIAFTDEARRFMTGYIEAEFCAPADGVSARELLEQLASLGGRAAEADSAGWFLAEGTGPIADHLAARLGSSVVLNAPVRRVQQEADLVIVETETEAYRARNLIVATPPQLYGAMGLLPLLPDHRRAVIAGYRPGSVVKTVLVFETRWWRDQGLSGSLLAPGALCNAAMDASSPEAATGVLVLFSTAASGQELGQTTVEADRITRIMHWLRSVTNQGIPEPIAGRSTDWSAEPWSLGGYASRRSPGGWAAAPDLFARIGRIHFAGTETATVWRSFMEGALQSAERAAEAVRTTA